MDIVERARVFATAAHSTVRQIRKYTNEPYINHPAEVVGILSAIQPSEEMLAAAWLHDVVEDTGVPLCMIRKEFGHDVAYMVAGLTDISTPEMGNRAARKALDLAHTAQQWASTKTVKLADLISNTRSIVQFDPTFAKVYMAEKRELLKVLTDGDQRLWSQANSIVGAYYGTAN